MVINIFIKLEKTVHFFHNFTYINTYSHKKLRNISTDRHDGKKTVIDHLA